MQWRSYVIPAVLVFLAALFIQLVADPWASALAAGAAVALGLWVYEQTKGRK